MSETEPQSSLSSLFPEIPESIATAILGIPKCPRYVIALSGGMDSMLLLKTVGAHLKSQGASVTAVHVNHSLSPNATHWADFCEQQCQLLDIECSVAHVSLGADSANLEERARDLRYSIFEKNLSSHACLLMGHHLNDNVETLLMRFARGSGLKGLTGVPQSRPLGEGLLFRPWLRVSRDELLSYAEKIGLQWVEDESNESNKFDRNYIRHNIVPAFASRWGDVLSQIQRSAGQLNEANQVLEELLAEKLEGLLDKNRGGQRPLLIEKLLGLPEKQRTQILKYWLSSKECGAPSAKLLSRILSEVVTASDDGQPEVNWAGYSLRRFDGALFVVNQRDLLPITDTVDIPTDQLAKGRAEQDTGFSKEYCFGPYTVRCEWANYVSDKEIPVPQQDLGCVCHVPLPQAGGSISIQSRQGGERIKPSGSQKRRELKKLLQEAGVPPWERSRLPIILVDNQVAQVANLWTDESFQARPGQPALRIEFLLTK